MTARRRTVRRVTQPPVAADSRVVPPYCAAGAPLAERGSDGRRGRRRADEERVDGRLAQAVEPQPRVDSAILVAADRRGREAEPRGGQAGALDHVAGLQQHEAVAPIAVLERAPVEDGGDED